MTPLRLPVWLVDRMRMTFDGEAVEEELVCHCLHQMGLPNLGLSEIDYMKFLCLEPRRTTRRAKRKRKCRVDHLSHWDALDFYEPFAFVQSIPHLFQYRNQHRKTSI